MGVREGARPSNALFGMSFPAGRESMWSCKRSESFAEPLLLQSDAPSAFLSQSP